MWAAQERANRGSGLESRSAQVGRVPMCVCVCACERMVWSRMAHHKLAVGFLGKEGVDVLEHCLRDPLRGIWTAGM